LPSLSTTVIGVFAPIHIGLGAKPKNLGVKPKALNGVNIKAINGVNIKAINGVKLKAIKGTKLKAIKGTKPNGAKEKVVVIVFDGKDNKESPLAFFA
jgi:hypothetical protein